MNKIAIFIGFLALMNSCKFSWDIGALYAQKIENSSKVIYKFDAFGRRDSHQYGFIIYDENEKFEVDIKKKLPFYELSEIPNQLKIEGISNEHPDLENDNAKPIFKPMKIQKTNEEGIEIENKIYQYNGYSERNKAYRTFEFENFKETSDSLIFYNLNDKKSIDETHWDKLKIRKGEVYLLLNDFNYVQSIQISGAYINPKTNELDSVVHYHLTPKEPMKSISFSERGIFRSIKISNVKK